MDTLLYQILDIIRNVKEDEEKLQIILDFLEENISVDESDYSAVDELPDKYKSIVNEIAQYIDMGMICYLNLETDEIDSIPQGIFNEIDMLDEPEDIKQELIDIYGSDDIKFLDWENPIEFEPLPPFESFKIMESYVQTLPDDEKILPQLINALRNRKPFANFGRIINNSYLRNEWFKFKQQWLDNLVAGQLLVELDKLKENNNDI